MAYAPIAFTAPNYRDNANEWIKAYEPGTTTPKVMALESNGGTQVAKLQLNADGFIVSAGAALVIPYLSGAYDLWLFPTEAEADSNITTNAIRLADDILGVLTDSAIDTLLINDLSQAYEFITLEGDPDSAIESLIDLPVGKKVTWNERQTGTGGAGAGVIALTSNVTPNTFDVIVSVGVPTKSIVLTTVNQTIELDQLGANIGDGYAAIQYAADNYRNSIANSSLSNTSNVINIPSGHKLTTDNLSKINATADTVAVVVQGQFALFDGFQVETTFIGHTKNLVEVGDVGFKADRSRISNLIITGAGNDGLQIKNGNLGVIENVTSTGNGRDGINFEHATSADNQNWAFEGFVDAINNVRDGVNFEAGSSVGDAFSSRKHHGDITCQQNGRYGFYCGTSGHDLVIYSENNTTQNIFFDQFGMGSTISIIEGTDFIETTVGSNQITVFSMNANNIAGYKTTLRLAGGANGGLWIDNDDGTAGVYIIKKTATRTLNHYYATSGSAWNVYHDNDSGYGVLTWFDGNVSPLRDNLWSCGTGSNRWTTIYATSGIVNTSDEREKTPLINIEEAEKLVGLELKGLIKKYKWLDAIEKKGEEKARIHFGIGAQTVKTTFEKHGLDGFEYGCLCYDEWEEVPEVKDESGNVTTMHKAAGNRYGVRVDELLFLIVASI